MSRDLLAYGLTTTAVTPGASAFVSVPMNPQVVSRFVYASGGTLYISGQTGAAGVSGLVQVPAVGISIPGPTSFYLLGAGAANIYSYLTQGYTGSAIPTP